MSLRSIDDGLVRFVGSVSYIPSPIVADAVLTGLGSACIASTVWNEKPVFVPFISAASIYSIIRSARRNDLILRFDSMSDHDRCRYDISKIASRVRNSSQFSILYSAALAASFATSGVAQTIPIAAAFGLYGLSTYCVRHISDKYAPFSK